MYLPIIALFYKMFMQPVNMFCSIAWFEADICWFEKPSQKGCL